MWIDNGAPCECPRCGSWNTAEDIISIFCMDCDWEEFFDKEEDW